MGRPSHTGNMQQINFYIYLDQVLKSFSFHQIQLIQHQKNIPHIHIFNPTPLGCSRTRWKMREVYFIIRRAKRVPTQSYEQIEKKKKRAIIHSESNDSIFHILPKMPH